MAILIKGMEMPKEGSWITLRVFPDGQCVLHSWCGNDDENKFEFMEHLTAVPVPEPYGRLIDVNELFRRMFIGEDGRAYPNRNVDNFPYMMPLEDIKHFLLNAPTIIEAEPICKENKLVEEKCCETCEYYNPIEKQCYGEPSDGCWDCWESKYGDDNGTICREGGSNLVDSIDIV